MPVIGLIKEGKIPIDNRVALTPHQCKWLVKNIPGCNIKVQHSADRCYTDVEYKKAGIALGDDLDDCDILLGIKEVPVAMLIPNKTYLFFSHTKKTQPCNSQLKHSMMDKRI